MFKAILQVIIGFVLLSVIMIVAGLAAFFINQWVTNNMMLFLRLLFLVPVGIYGGIGIVKISYDLGRSIIK